MCSHFLKGTLLVLKKERNKDIRLINSIKLGIRRVAIHFDDIWQFFMSMSKTVYCTYK